MSELSSAKTIRLFEDDPYLSECEARVLEIRATDDRYAVILDRTVFYPTSGGQPNDIGRLNDVSVIDVLEEGEEVLHIVENSIPEGTTVTAKIDWDRRFDHMQQHTGQHILSQAFVQIAKAQTVGFHLGETGSTIDIDVPKLTDEVVQKVETLANGVVFQNLAMDIKRLPPDQIDSIEFRKQPKTEGDIRVVSIPDFDASGCCGTHVQQTGEVGVIKVERWEKYKGGMRVSFLCGWRALGDYQNRLNRLRDVCLILNVGDAEAVEKVQRWQDDRKTTAKRMKTLVDTALDVEAKALIDETKLISNVRIIDSVFSEREMDEVQRLAQKLIQYDDTVVLFGRKGERADLVFGRSKNLELDLRPLIQTACETIDGKGGGSPSMGRGSGQNVSELEGAIQAAREKALAELT